MFYDQIWGGNRKRTSAGVANICIYTIDTVRNSPRYDPSRTLIANAVALAFDFEPDPSSLIYGFTLESMNKRIELNDDDLCQNFYYVPNEDIYLVTLKMVFWSIRFPLDLFLPPKNVSKARKFFSRSLMTRLWVLKML